VPCGSIYAIDEIFEDPQFIARGNLATIKDPRVGELVVANVVPRLSETPGSVETLGPPLGAHNDEIFERIGIGAAERKALAGKNVI
jgi:succinyl-CoA:(S)-malate CoA-transferase subunit B